MTLRDLSRYPGMPSIANTGTPTPPMETQQCIADDIAERTARVAKVAAVHVEEVDRNARFPREAITTAKALGLMGIMAPAALGGEGVGLGEVADICYALGRACASTAMIYAMHQVNVACLVRHGMGSDWHEDFIRRLVRDQLLLASSTTEGQGGGAVRVSLAPIEPMGGGRIRLERAASVISYGAEADAIVTTARREAAAAASDQVLAVFSRDDYDLQRTLSWDTFGMRGTCSAGFALRATGDAAQVLPVAFERIHARSMLPTAHILWSSVWAGIAAAAVGKSRRHVRKARASAGEPPPSAPYFTRAHAALRQLRALVASSLERYETIQHDPAALMGLDFQSDINLLKVDASELAVAAVSSALRAGGLTSYRNDSDVAIGRHLRDVLSAPIMVNNDRILASVAASALLTEVPTGVRAGRRPFKRGAYGASR
jgi:acyl-CoA dehydrogenase